MTEKVELIDLVNDNGEIVKTGVPRDDASHYEGLHMQIVIVVIGNGLKEILIHERHHDKSVDKNKIDHVCGGIESGEKPITAAERESREEMGLKPDNLQVVGEEVNSYGRYRYLLVGTSNEPPDNFSRKDAEWAGYYSLDTLRTKQESGEMVFVDGFFEDAELALAALGHNQIR